MKAPTREMALNRWHGILPEFGIERRYLVNKHGPCPICEGRDRFRFDNKAGAGTWFCNQCGSGDGFKLAQLFSGQAFSEVAAQIDKIVGNIDETPEPKSQDPGKVKRRLQMIGSELQAIGDLDPVGRYLRRRGIKHIPRQFLRYHPSLAYYEDSKLTGRYPAMVAAFRHPSGSIETFHVTYLTQDGEKAPVPSVRKVMGKQQGLSGCAIRLSQIEAHIGIAEGIETALSVTELFGIPCWACYSDNGVQSFEPPEGIRELTIYSDTDTNYAGQAAGTAAAKRLTRQGYTVHLARFLDPGKDYNDLLLEASCPA
jgi:putative DNA primase/helicase